MKIKNTLIAAALGVGLFSTTSAHAVLELTLDGQSVYNSDPNISCVASVDATGSFIYRCVETAETVETVERIEKVETPERVERIETVERPERDGMVSQVTPVPEPHT